MERQQQIDYNKHKDDFMMYVWNNHAMLCKAIKKNITMDEEIFDDVTADTLCRIGEYILGRQVYINDFKNMFFLSCKRQFIAEQNKKRDRQKRYNRDFFDNIFNGLEKREDKNDLDVYYGMLETNSMDGEKKAEKVHRLFKYLEDELNKQFDGNEVDIFLIYFRLKSERKGISYKKLASIMDKDVKYITKTIVKIKKYIRESEEIQENKKKIMSDNDD